jgi:hypothetical protein
MNFRQSKRLISFLKMAEEKIYYRDELSNFDLIVERRRNKSTSLKLWTWDESAAYLNLTWKQQLKENCSMSSTASRVTLHKLLEEMKGSIVVFLTKEGITEFKETFYLRKNGSIVCSRIFVSSDSHYLSVEVRYYVPGSQVPKHTFIAIPHRFIKCMESETQVTFKNFTQKK